MDRVRLGVIGCGGMAQNHMEYFSKVRGLEFVAACDVDAGALDRVRTKYGIRAFADGFDLIRSGEVDAILIATPHWFHPEYALAGFEAGVHVLVEKPVAVTAKQAEQVNRAYTEASHTGLVYSAMFSLRTRAEWRFVKRMLEQDRIGDLMRVSWTITTWFRTQAYYDSGGWRATWKGEGGGVLINQCPHQLDLFYWFVGMPKRVQAIAGLGKHHNIEVEDEVVAMMEFANGAVGTFITSTGEAPGVNRLEIVGDKGTLVVGDGGITLIENGIPAREFCATSTGRFDRPERTNYAIEPGGKNPDHQGITENFVNAILHGEKLIAPATEGIHGLELGNAMLMAGITRKAVKIPTDREAYDELIRELIANSRFQRAGSRRTQAGDLAGSFTSSAVRS